MSDSMLIRPGIFNSFPELRCAISTRSGGVSPSPLGLNMSYRVGDEASNVDENRRRFFQALGVSAERLAVPQQCHSARVLLADTPGTFDAVDGLVTDRSDLWLSVSVADCVPVFLFDVKKKAVAGIHAGWRGSAADIVGRGVHLMETEFSCVPSDLIAFVGPSAGPCCYEVGGEVAEQFGDGALLRRDGKLFLDLKAVARGQLLRKGVERENIEVSPFCTICSHELFHSFRRDGNRSGRMLGIIGLKG
ncbi:MAG: peptidoglycan editing factor PgeF [Ignavibacteriales bacterium]|nr:peptidoglycan editing factor PgeF [Ignavibacteriales bacterium]